MVRGRVDQNAGSIISGSAKRTPDLSMIEIDLDSIIAFPAATEAAASGFSIVGAHCPQHAGGTTIVG